MLGQEIADSPKLHMYSVFTGTLEILLMATAAHLKTMITSGTQRNFSVMSRYNTFDTKSKFLDDTHNMIELIYVSSLLSNPEASDH